MAATRIAVLSDTHFPGPGGAPLESYFRGLARLERLGVDALVLAGDIVAAPRENYIKGFARLLRKHYGGPVYAILGNHEHYLSRKRLERGWDSVMVALWVEEALCRHGIELLTPRAPVRVGGVNLVGVTGWYDYSFGPQVYTEEDYERCNTYGISPEVLRECDRRALWGMSPWCPPGARLDCSYVKFPGGHKWYASINLGLLERQLSLAEAPVVAVLHHAPHRRLLRYTGDPERDFYRAYDGSQELGRLLLRHKEKLAAVVYGHLHGHSASRVAEIEGVPHVNAYPVHEQATGLAVIELEGSGRTRIMFVR